MFCFLDVNECAQSFRTLHALVHKYTRVFSVSCARMVSNLLAMALVKLKVTYGMYLKILLLISSIHIQ